MPPRSVLVVLTALALLPPLVAQATGTVVGSYAMFARLDRYHIVASIDGGVGPERVRFGALSSHLSRDARQVLVPADGWAASSGQAEIVRDGLPDVAAWLCRLHPDARSARVELHERPWDGAMETVATVTRLCP